LDTIFQRCETLNTKLDTLPKLIKVFKENLLTQAVTGVLTEDWREKKSVREEWKAVKLEQLITVIQAGKNFKCPSIPVTYDTVGLVKISAVTWGKFDANETKTVTNPKFIIPELFIKEGDFLFSRANTLELVGASVIVEKLEYKIMLSDKIWRVVFINDIVKKYINHFLKSKAGRNEIESRASGNQLSMRNISQKKFKDIDLVLPPLQEQQEIVRRLEELFLVLDGIEAQHKVLKEKIDNLPALTLEKAFKGELVEKEKNDEPAEALLQRITKSKIFNE
jgi:type I restriction enzyme S subunit